MQNSWFGSSRGRSRRYVIGCRVVLLVLCGVLAWATGENVTGSIAATDVTGTTVNGNNFTLKTDVYFNGGPQNGNSSGPAPTGTWYFQVTSDPAAGNNEVLLSADDIHCREVKVQTDLFGTNRIVGVVNDTACPTLLTGNLSPHVNGNTDPSSGSTPVEVCPVASSRPDSLSHASGSKFDGSNWCDTTNNPGGGYKIWATPVSMYPAQNTHPYLTDSSGNILYDTQKHPQPLPDPTYCTGNITFGFCANNSKNDHFRIAPVKCKDASCATTASIAWPLGGHKFYDASTDGVWQGTLDGDNNFTPISTEPPINGWEVRIIKSCQENQTILANYLAPFLNVTTVTLPVNDGDLIARQLQLTTSIGTFETDAFQGTTPSTFTIPGPYPAPNTAGTLFPGGFYQYKDLNAGGHYSVCEIIPDGYGMTFPPGTSSLSGKPVWRATGKTEDDDHFLPTDSANFGNVCTGPPAGTIAKTLGFWSNTNGESVMAYGPANPNKVPKSCYAAADATGYPTSTALYSMQKTLKFLSGINLVNASGQYIGSSDTNANPLASTNLGTAYSNQFDPYCFFRSWILNATSTNSAYMLSAQLAAMELNVYFGYVQPNALIYAPGANSANNAGFATVAEIMFEANNSLGTNPNVVVNHLLNNNVSLKTYQVALKDALDNANNNLGFVQAAGSCPKPVYASASCTTSDAPSGTTLTSQPIPENLGTENPALPGCTVNELTNIVGSVNCSASGGTWSAGTPSGSCACPGPNNTIVGPQANGTCAPLP